MKIAIISDSHDNLPNIAKAVKYINKEKIPAIIHCGDVCSPETLKKIIDLFAGQTLHLVKGNADNDPAGFTDLAAKNPSKLKYHGQTGKLEIDNLIITFCHEPFIAQKMAQAQRYNFIFNGHSHKPWQEKIGKTEIINPGNLAGILYKATFAVFDTSMKKADLILLEKIAD